MGNSRHENRVHVARYQAPFDRPSYGYYLTASYQAPPPPATVKLARSASPHSFMLLAGSFCVMIHHNDLSIGSRATEIPASYLNCLFRRKAPLAATSAFTEVCRDHRAGLSSPEYKKVCARPLGAAAGPNVYYSCKLLALVCSSWPSNRALLACSCALCYSLFLCQARLSQPNDNPPNVAKLKCLC